MRDEAFVWNVKFYEKMNLCDLICLEKWYLQKGILRKGFHKTFLSTVDLRFQISSSRNQALRPGREEVKCLLGEKSCQVFYFISLRVVLLLLHLTLSTCLLGLRCGVKSTDVIFLLNNTSWPSLLIL